MLDWSRIDNYYVLQRLINHLFAIECDSPGFIPSSPYIGADGAWDGFYVGTYRDEKGLWSMQSKWTSKSHSKAVASLKPIVKKELQKARGNNVNHLRVATNAELTIEQVRKLEDLNEGHVNTLKIWHRENLDRRIEHQPYLKHLFFGVPQYPKFVPWNRYFSEREHHLLPVPATVVPKFKDYMDKAKRFLLSQTLHILLIVSPDGFGKSHLLREIAKESHKTDSRRQTWMVRPRIRRMEESLQDEIVSGRRYLLIYDDAHKYEDEVEPLISFSKIHSDGSLKLILSSTPSAFQSLYETMARMGCEEIYEVITITSWKKEDLVSLLRIAARRDEIKNEERIAGIYSIPYLITWIGRQITKQPSLDFQKVKEKFVNSLEFEVKKSLRGVFLPSQSRNFILSLACSVPFGVNSPEILGFLSGHFAKQLTEIKDSILILVETNVLKLVGHSIRFDPDIRGDIYLSYRLEMSSKQKIIDLIKAM